MAIGFPFACPAGTAQAVIARSARGRLGFSRETLVWFGAVWLPVWSIQLGLTRIDGTFRKVQRTSRRWNLYEGLSGRLVGMSSGPFPFVQIDVSGSRLPTRVKAAAIGAGVTTSYDKWRSVTTVTAKQRHAEKLASLGVHMPLSGVSIEDSVLAYVPIWIGFVQKGAQERLVAVDGTTGAERPEIGSVVTSHAQVVRESIR